MFKYDSSLIIEPYSRLKNWFSNATVSWLMRLNHCTN